MLHFCDDVIEITDDVVINGKDDEEHGRCLHKLMKVAHEHDLVLNGAKCAVRQPSIVINK